MLINLALVRQIDIIDSFNCRLWFDEQHSIELKGDSAKALFDNIEQFHVLNPQ